MGLASVLVDSREPEWCQRLAFGGCPVCVAALDAGDILAATTDDCLLCIERKEANDLLNTLRDDRLFPQMTKIREASRWAYLVITGQLIPGPSGKTLVNGVESGFNWASVAGALLTVQELGVHVLHVASDYDYEAAIIRLGNRERQTMRIYPAREAAFVSDEEAILSSLPGVGPEHAKKLLEYCGFAGAAFAYLTETDQTGREHIPGIGEQTRRRIRRALGLDDGLQLALITK